MTTKETLSIRQPEDILGYIPHLLGYWPEDSLVAITMQGKLLGATLRVDLPRSRSARALGVFVEQVRDYLISDGLADGVVLVVYTDSGWAEGMVGRNALPLLTELQRSLDQVDMSVRDAWLVGSEYWRSAFCADEQCCPSPGLPVDRIRNSSLSAEMVYRGSNIGVSPRSQSDPLVLSRPGALDPEVIDAESRFAERLMGAWRSERCLDAILNVWLHVLDASAGLPGEAKKPAESVNTELAGFLRSTLRVPAWRDAVVVMAAAGTGSAKAGAAAFGMFRSAWSDVLPFDMGELGLSPKERGFMDGAEGASSLTDIFGYGDVLLGMQPAIPDWRRLDALQQVLSRLCVEGEEGEVAAAALTLQGWVAWCKGSGSYAHACLVRAEAANPGYRLAELLEDILGQGTICAWARSPGSAWGSHRDVAE